MRCLAPGVFFLIFFLLLKTNKCFIDSINNIVPAQPQPQQQRQQLSQWSMVSTCGSFFFQSFLCFMLYLFNVLSRKILLTTSTMTTTTACRPHTNHHFQTSSKPTNRRSGDDSNSSSRNGNGIGSSGGDGASTTSSWWYVFSFYLFITRIRMGARDKRGLETRRVLSSGCVFLCYSLLLGWLHIQVNISWLVL